MKIRDRAGQLCALLENNPAVETTGDLRVAREKLLKAIDGFLLKAETAIYRNSREYIELLAILTLPEYKDTATLEWFNERGSSEGLKFQKLAKKEKDEFVLTMVRSGRAPSIIQELRDTPRQRMQSEFNSLAGKSDEAVALALKAMKPASLEQFCKVNGIPLRKTARGTIDRKRITAETVLKLNELREYLKL